VLSDNQPWNMGKALQDPTPWCRSEITGSRQLASQGSKSSQRPLPDRIIDVALTVAALVPTLYTAAVDVKAESKLGVTRQRHAWAIGVADGVLRRKQGMRVGTVGHEKALRSEDVLIAPRQQLDT
jgi:hypothetical protein